MELIEVQGKRCVQVNASDLVLGMQLYGEACGHSREDIKRVVEHVLDQALERFDEDKPLQTEPLP